MTGVDVADVVLPQLGADELADVVVALWRSATAVAGPAGLPAVGAWPAAGTSGLGAHVAVEGPSATVWSGDVVVCCSGGAARRWARQLLAAGDDEPVTDDDVRDVLGEVANVVAGVVKARCAPGGLLGLPRVDGRPTPLGPPHGRGVVLAVALHLPGADDDVTVVALVSR